MEFLGNYYILQLPRFIVLQNDHCQLITLTAILEHFYTQHIHIIQGEDRLYFSTATVNVLSSELGVKYMDLVSYGEDNELVR